MINSKASRITDVFIVIFFAALFLLICGCESDALAPYTIVDDTGAGSPGTRAASSFGNEGQAINIVQKGLTDGNPQIRASAIEIAAAAGRREFMPYVQRLLADEYVPVRFAAAVAIGDAKYKPARSDIAELLKDNDENVRIAASYALSKLNGGSASKELVEAIKSRESKVQANAAFLLGKTGDSKFLPVLYEALNDETSDERLRLNCIEAIARLGDENIYQKLWAMLISAYADDRIFGIQAMGALSTSLARDAIVTMLKDDLPEVRLAAAEQLGRLGDTAGEKVVLDALTVDAASAADAEGRARIETLAASAIGQIRTPALKKYLPELLKNESRIVRLAAAKAVLQSSSGNNIGL